MSKVQKASELPNEGFVRLPQILSIIPISKTSFLQRVKEGRFPAPIKISARMNAWRVADIRQLISQIENGEL